MEVTPPGMSMCSRLPQPQNRLLGMAVMRLGRLALFRLEHPESSLQELGGYLNPPVGKSGVNHRLRKLSEIAEKIRA